MGRVSTECGQDLGDRAQRLQPESYLPLASRTTNTMPDASVHIRDTTSTDQGHDVGPGCTFLQGPG